MELHEILIATLQQQTHLHATARRVDQRTAKPPSGQEIGVGNDDLLRGPGDGAAVGALDTAAVEHVVTQQQRGTCHLASLRVGFGRAAPRQVQTGCSQRAEGMGKMMGPHVAHALHAPPQLRRGFLGLQHQCARGAHGKVQPGLVQATMMRIMKVVQDVDAAAKGQPPIDHAELAVQPAPAAGNQQSQRTQGRVDRPLHAGGLEALAPQRRQRIGAHTIDHHPGCHAARCGAHQRFSHLDGLAGEVEDVGFQPDLGTGVVHGGNQRREVFLAALQQLDLVRVARVVGTRSHVSPDRIRRSAAGDRTSVPRSGHGARAGSMV